MRKARGIIAEAGLIGEQLARERSCSFALEAIFVWLSDLVKLFGKHSDTQQRFQNAFEASEPCLMVGTSEVFFLLASGTYVIPQKSFWSL